VLAALDDRIGHNERTGSALELLAREIFRAWFVDFEPGERPRPPARPHSPPCRRNSFEGLPPKVIDSELGPIPDGWELKPLYETAQYINGAAFKNQHFCDPSDGLPRREDCGIEERYH